MANAQFTLSGTPTVIPIDAPVSQVLVTIQGAAAAVYATIDGSNPAAPTATTNDNRVHVIPGVLGAQALLSPSAATAPGLAGPPGLAAPTLRLASAGAAVVSVEW